MIQETHYISRGMRSMKRAMLGLALLGSLGAHAQIINTVAGTGVPFYSGDGGPAISATFTHTRGIAIDASTGNYFVSDYGSSAVRMVNTSGIITCVAGIPGSWGYSGDGGPATAAKINMPWGLAADGAGNLYIADAGNAVVRRVDLTTGTIYTFAGTGVSGYSGDGGPATSAKLAGVTDVAVDAAGNVYICDQGNNRIRMVDLSGIITTVAGTGVSGFSGDGGAATSAKIAGAEGIGVTPAGEIYIADGGNNRVRKVDLSGIINTVAGNGTAGYSGDGGAATSAQMQGVTDVAVDASGNMFIANDNNYVIRKVDAGGTITTYAGNGTQGTSGDGGLATLAELWEPEIVAVDAAGDLYYTGKYEFKVREITPGHNCYDDDKLTVKNIGTDKDGNCIYTATASVTTANMVMGYSWQGIGAAVIHHTHATTDNFTFIIPPGGSATIGVTIFLVDSNFTDSTGPCCQAYMTTDVKCDGKPGEGKKTASAGTKNTMDQVSIYPNPATDVVTVTGTTATINNVEVLDVNGKKVAEYSYSNTKEANVSLGKLPAGTYLLRVNGSTSKVVTKK